MDFGSVTWVAYLAAGVAGGCFGVLQGMLMKRAALAKKPRRSLYLLKFALWAVVLAGMAILSVPLLLCFTAVAALTMLVVSLWFLHHARKEGD